MEKSDERVILVVGADAGCKARVAECIAQSLDAKEYRRKSAVADQVTDEFRIFKKRSSPAVAVVDTVPFSKFYLGLEVYREAKRWISQNALRRMLGKEVSIVCVVSCSDAHSAEEDISEIPDPNFYYHVYNWLDFMGRFIFPEYKQSIVLLGVTKDENFDDNEAVAANFRIKNFVRVQDFPTRNIVYADLRDRDSFAEIVESAVGNIFRLESSEESRLSIGRVPFQIRDLPLNEHTVGLLGPWVPERMILFGRSGSGKSTLAQMLTLGKLDLNSQFAASSGIRGQTTSIHHGEGRGWYVVDTPGFGEAAGGSISSEEAKRKIKRYVQLIGGIYTHYVYVVKMDRIDKLEDGLWKFFKSLFGESIRDHFTVIVTNANREWVTENIDYLKVCFDGCESFLSADFPSIVDDDDEWEKEYQQVREESLRELEHGLTSLQRGDTWCDFGEWSKMTVMDGIAQANFDLKATTDVLQKLVNAMRIGVYKANTMLHRLVLLLSPEEGCLLLPQMDS